MDTSTFGKGSGITLVKILLDILFWYCGDVSEIVLALPPKRLLAKTQIGPPSLKWRQNGIPLPCHQCSRGVYQEHESSHPCPNFLSCGTKTIVLAPSSQGPLMSMVRFMALYGSSVWVAGLR